MSIRRALPIVLAFLAACILMSLVVTSIGRSQGGGLDAAPAATGRAAITACHRDLLALGLRFRCDADVAWNDGGMEPWTVWSPTDRTGEDADVVAVMSREVDWSSRRNSFDVVNVLTTDHPRGSQVWGFLAAVLPITSLFVVLLVWGWIERRRSSRRRAPRGQRQS